MCSGQGWIADTSPHPTVRNPGSIGVNQEEVLGQQALRRQQEAQKKALIVAAIIAFVVFFGIPAFLLISFLGRLRRF
jgi:hypothetical protein